MDYLLTLVSDILHAGIAARCNTIIKNKFPSFWNLRKNIYLSDINICIYFSLSLYQMNLSYIVNLTVNFCQSKFLLSWAMWPFGLLVNTGTYYNNSSNINNLNFYIWTNSECFNPNIEPSLSESVLYIWTWFFFFVDKTSIMMSKMKIW